MTVPNFIIIGAGKSGTTSLHEYLKQHPQVYMSPLKEPNFFAYDGKAANSRWATNYPVKDIEAYLALFRGVTDEIAIGEASPTYLFSPVAPERIRQYLPAVRLLAILRHPVERAYAAFQMRLRNGREPLGDFAAAVRAEREGRRDELPLPFRYVNAGMYHGFLKRYYDRFDQRQIRVYLFDDLRADPNGMLRDIFRFLGADDTFAPDTSIQYNVGRGVPRYRRLNMGLSWAIWRLEPLRLGLGRPLKAMKQRNLVEPPPLAPVLRQELIELYRDDILKLQDLIQRDLSAWLAGSDAASAAAAGP